jgi:hypothetical protein
MGQMRNSGQTSQRPTPKSRNKKSTGPSLSSSPGTRKTMAGSKKGLEKRKAGPGVITPAAAKAKKGTVSRSSKSSTGKSSTGKSNSGKTMGKLKIGAKTVARSKSAGMKTAATKTTAKSTLKKPASRSKGKNSAISSSKNFGQPKSRMG